MPIRHLLPLIFTLMLLTLSPQRARLQDAPPQRVVGYYAGWTYHTLPVADIRGDLLTHLNYAFIDVSGSLECDHIEPYDDIEYTMPDDSRDQLVGGNFNQLALLRGRYPHLKVLLAIGGYTNSARFSDAALTPESRQHFAESCVAFMERFGFDGLDVDWEYPSGNGLEGNVERPEDRDNFTLLLAALREALDNAGEGYLLTAAISADPWNFPGYDFTGIMESLDWINLMTYDYAGSWSAVTDFLAPLYGDSSVDTSVTSLISMGVAPADIVLGIPFYGVGWSGVAAGNNGLYQTYTTLAPDGGAYGYNTIGNLFPTLTRYWDDAAQSAWLYDAASEIMISYEDPEAVARKGEYVRELGLGGMMIWELSQDDPDNTLLNVIYTAVMGM